MARAGAIAAIPGDRRRGLSRGQQSGLGQIGGMGESCRLTYDDPDPGPPVAPGGELLDLSVVERDAGARPVLGEDFCEIASSSQRFAQDPLEDGPLDEIGRRSVDDAQNFRPSTPPSTAPAAAPPAASL